MDPLLIAYMAKFGIDNIIGIIQAWEDSGKPNANQIRGAFITKKPEDYFETKPPAAG